MQGRDPEDQQRGVSPLELFFDLCFAAAITQVTAQLGSTLAAGAITGAIVGYLTVFFAVWWAWMNFTWFASAFDNDDVFYRLATLVQIAGALVLAAGTARAFRTQDFTVVCMGYGVMRAGLITLWLRAARDDPENRKVALRYAAGLAVAMVGWSLMALSGQWPLSAWALMALVELAIPPFAERAGPTPWNPYHIARRYGRFMIIMLGQSMVVATSAVRTALDGYDVTGSLLLVPVSGLVLVFSLWWLYFSVPAGRLLASNRQAFLWGYSHYLLFAATAALGAGLSLTVEEAVTPGHLPPGIVPAVVTIPVALFLVTLWSVHLRPYRFGKTHSGLIVITVALVLASAFSSWALPACALLVALVAGGTTVAGRSNTACL